MIRDLPAISLIDLIDNSTVRPVFPRSETIFNNGIPRVLEIFVRKMESARVWPVRLFAADMLARRGTYVAR